MCVSYGPFYTVIWLGYFTGGSPVGFQIPFSTGMNPPQFLLGIGLFVNIEVRRAGISLFSKSVFA